MPLDVHGGAKPEPTPRLLVDSAEAARLLSISARSLWGLTSPRGDMPCVKLGTSVRYDVRDLIAWIARHRA
jgi:hypothetical protein